MRKSLMTLTINLLIFSSFCLIAQGTEAVHFEGVKPTPFMVDFIGYITINGQDAAPGDVLGVFDDQGLLVGNVEITTPGQYGVLHIYGDDTTTPGHDGANDDSSLVFKVWQKRSQTEILVNVDMMSTQTLAAYNQSEIPPRWTKDRDGFMLNLNIGFYIDQEQAAITLYPGLNLVSFPPSVEYSCSLVSCLQNSLVEHKVQVFKIQTLHPYDSGWLSAYSSAEEEFSPGLGWLIYTQQSSPITLNLGSSSPGVTLSPRLIPEFSAGLNLIKHTPLVWMTGADNASEYKWPADLFRRLDKAGKDSASIIRYDAPGGRWQAKYQFFGLATGTEHEIKEEGYLLYIRE